MPAKPANTGKAIKTHNNRRSRPADQRIVFVSMKRIITLFLFSLLVPLFALPALAQSRKQEPMRVLFVGNSFTFFCSTPEIFEFMCKSKKVPVEIASSTPGGYSFAQHAKDKRTQQLLSQKWDWVILQGQSVEPVYRKNECLYWGKHLAKQAKDNGAKVLFFNTWGYRQPATKVFDLDMHNKLCQTYCELALATQSHIAPCGPAWKTVNEKYPELDLYNKNDGNCHPSLQGAYLNACIFFTITTGKSPRNLPPVSDKGDSKLSVTKKRASILQQVAEQTVKTFSPQKFLRERESAHQALPTLDALKGTLRLGMTKAEAEKFLGKSFQSNRQTRLFLYKAQNDVIIWVTYAPDAKIVSAHANDWKLEK